MLKKMNSMKAKSCRAPSAAVILKWSVVEPLELTKVGDETEVEDEEDAKDLDEERITRRRQDVRRLQRCCHGVGGAAPGVRSRARS